MKLRLFPQEPAGLNLLSLLARQIVLATGTLSEILGAPASEHGRLVEDMHNHEAKSAELHFALLTHMRTSFVNPLPREDMYALSRYLNEAMEKLDAAAELVSLYKLDRLPKRAADQLEIISRQAELTVDAMRKSTTWTTSRTTGSRSSGWPSARSGPTGSGWRTCSTT